MHFNGPEHCVMCGGVLPTPRGIPTRTCDDPGCRLRYQRHLQQGDVTCRACGKPFPAHAASRGARTCDELQCRLEDRRFEALPAHGRCRLCRTPLRSSRNSDGVCDDRDCQSAWSSLKLAERSRQRREEFARQTVRCAEFRDELAVLNNIPEPETYFVSVLKHFRAQQVPLPEHRREELRTRLEGLVEEFKSRHDAGDSAEPGAAEMEAGFVWAQSGRTWSAGFQRAGNEEQDDAEAPSDETSADCCFVSAGAMPADRKEHPWPDVGPAGERLTGSICAHCQGFCCQDGKTHAFLTVETIESFLQRRPDIHLDQVVDEYLNHLPEKSYENSCVFHSGTGCSLVPEMRAAICGLYFCWSQQNLRAAMEQGAPRRAFVALLTDDEPVEGRFLDGNSEKPGE